MSHGGIGKIVAGASHLDHSDHSNLFLCWKTMLIHVVVCCGEVSRFSWCSMVQWQSSRTSSYTKIFSKHFLYSTWRIQQRAYLKSASFPTKSKNQKIEKHGHFANAFGSHSSVSTEGLSRPPKSNNKPYLGASATAEWTILWLQLGGTAPRISGPIQCLNVIPSFHITMIIQYPAAGLDHPYPLTTMVTETESNV